MIQSFEGNVFTYPPNNLKPFNGWSKTGWCAGWSGLGLHHLVQLIIRYGLQEIIINYFLWT
jgi:hypothetical protein